MTLHALGALGVCVTGVGFESSAFAQTGTPDQGPASNPAQSNDGESVVVTGVRPLLGDKIPLSIKDTPQSVNVVPQQLLQEQAITRLEDAPVLGVGPDIGGEGVGRREAGGLADLVDRAAR